MIVGYNRLVDIKDAVVVWPNQKFIIEHVKQIVPVRNLTIMAKNRVPRGRARRSATTVGVLQSSLDWRSVSSVLLPRRHLLMHYVFCSWPYRVSQSELEITLFHLCKAWHDSKRRDRSRSVQCTFCIRYTTERRKYQELCLIFQGT